MLEDQRVGFIPDQLDYRYGEEGLGLWSQLGFEHFLLCTKLPVPNHRITTSQVSTPQEKSSKRCFGKREGSQGPQFTPIPQSQPPDSLAWGGASRGGRRKGKSFLPIIFSPWSQMFLLEIPEDFSILFTAESDSLALNKYPLKNEWIETWELESGIFPNYKKLFEIISSAQLSIHWLNWKY